MGVLILSFSANKVNEDSYIPNKKGLTFACAGGSGNGTENTLQAFDTLNHFMKMDMIGRIPITKFNFEEQKQEIRNCISKFLK